MDTNFEQKVREKAYEIWKAAGMTDGMAHEHWVTAEKAVRSDSGKPVAKSAAAKKPDAKKPAPKAPAKPAKAKTSTKATAKGGTSKH